VLVGVRGCGASCFSASLNYRPTSRWPQPPSEGTPAPCVYCVRACVCAYVGVRVCACVCVCARARAEIASVSEHAHIDDHARPHHPSLHARIRPQIKLYFFFSSSSAAAAAAAAAVDHTRMNDECEIYGEMRICSQIWCAAEYGRESSLHISSG